MFNQKKQKKESLTTQGTETVIFVCNSETDGFREGDGDLMDKIVTNINQNNGPSIRAIRIVMYKQDIPEDRLSALQAGEIIWLAEKRGHDSKKYDIESFQELLRGKIQAEAYQGLKKIIYIGSRLDWVAREKESDTYSYWKMALSDLTIPGSLHFEEKKEKGREVEKEKEEEEEEEEEERKEIIYIYDEVILKQSGALFNAKFIKQLKEEGVHIVICCLEYKFFFRSKHALGSAFEMLRQHLFLADQIHFLTEMDLEHFQLTLKALSSSSVLQPLNVDDIEFASGAEKEKAKRQLALLGEEKGGKEEEEEKEKEEEKETLRFDFRFTRFKKNFSEDRKKEWLGSMEKKCFYSPGIYTVDPLKIKEKKKLSELKSRPKNILQFGMIRSQKGIDEALSLAKKLDDIGYGRLYIVGRIRDLATLRSLLLKIFECSDKEAKLERPKKSRKLIKLSEHWLNEEEFKSHKGNFKAEAEGSREKQFDLIHVTDTGKLYIVWYDDISNRVCEFKLIKDGDNALSSNLADLLSRGLEENKLRISSILSSNRSNNTIPFARFYYSNQSPTNKSKLLNKIIENVCEEQKIPYEKSSISQLSTKIKQAKGMSGLNKFGKALIKRCEGELKRKIKNIHIKLNVSENELHELANACRYAIKLDHKGMAENASSIVACFGLYLPVLTVQSYMTNQLFLEGGKYANTIITPEKAYHHYYEDANREIYELRPSVPSIEDIIAMLKSEAETEGLYEMRINALHQLYQDNYFSCDRLVRDIMEKITGNPQHTTTSKRGYKS